MTGLANSQREGCIQVVSCDTHILTCLQDLFERKIAPPFKPIVSSEADVRNFDPEFTTENPELTPPDAGR